MATQTQAVTLSEPLPEDFSLAEVDADAEFICGGACIAIAAGLGTAAGAGAGAGVNAAADCFAYGSIVLRKGVDGKREAVPIEAVKEGDQVLVKGASGLHFTPAVAVDLHPESKSEVLTLSTRSGHQVTLTDGHMMPVHSEGKEELLPARDVKVGNYLTIVNETGNTEISEVVAVSTVERSVGGLANILTGAETIVVNGVVGSVHAETTFKGVAGVLRPIVKFAYNIAGARAARYTYRTAEMLLAAE